VASIGVQIISRAKSNSIDERPTLWPNLFLEHTKPRAKKTIVFRPTLQIEPQISCNFRPKKRPQLPIFARDSTTDHQRASAKAKANLWPLEQNNTAASSQFSFGKTARVRN